MRAIPKKQIKDGLSSRPKFQDGFQNFTARLGLGQDNQLSQGSYSSNHYLTRNPQELEDMYRTSWLCDRVVNVVAEDMLRAGISLQSQLSPEKVDILLNLYRKTGINSRLSNAVKWSRLYGGALAVFLIDGHNFAEPLELENIQKNSFKGLYVLDRWQVSPSNETISELGPMFGYPEYYTLNTDTLQGQNIHHSRCIRFIGVDLPYRQRITEQHWGASVMEKCYDRLIAFDSATHGTANMLFKSFLRVIGVENLRQLLATGGKGEQGLVKMFSMIRQMQTNEGITLLDKNDTFTTHGWSFAGIYDAMQSFSEQISGATGIPLVRLLGQSPKGFSSGESDLRMYYDTIATLRDDDLRPALERIFPVLAFSLFEKPLEESFNFEFNSLWQQTELEKSQIANADATSINSLYQNGLLTQKTALNELRASSKVSGRFAHITDEEIENGDIQAPFPASF